MTDSILTKSQSIKLEPRIVVDDKMVYFIQATIRYDDSCNNGHNSFSITAETWGDYIACGCLHEEIKKAYPEYAHLIKWHLCSSEEPMYYIENTLYWAKHFLFDNARKTAIWEDATDEEFIEPIRLKIALIERLPRLMEEFKKDIEALGFTY